MVECFNQGFQFHTFFFPHCSTILSSLSSFSGGESELLLIIYTKISNTTMEMVGLSCFSGASGTPSCLHTCISVSRACWHCRVTGGPMTTKSIR